MSYLGTFIVLGRREPYKMKWLQCDFIWVFILLDITKTEQRIFTILWFLRVYHFRTVGESRHHQGAYQIDIEGKCGFCVLFGCVNK